MTRLSDTEWCHVLMLAKCLHVITQQQFQFLTSMSNVSPLTHIIICSYYYHCYVDNIEISAYQESNTHDN